MVKSENLVKRYIFLSFQDVIDFLLHNVGLSYKFFTFAYLSKKSVLNCLIL